MGKLFFVFVIVCVVLVCIGDWEWWVFVDWFGVGDIIGDLNLGYEVEVVY